MTLKYSYLLLISALFLSCASCNEKFFRAEGPTWGTTYHIIVQGDKSLADSAKVQMRAVDDELSMFNLSSTVTRINKAEQVSVSSLFEDVFNLSNEVWQLSEGAFDPTVGLLSDAWGFGASESDLLPDSTAIEEILTKVGFGDCYIKDGEVVKKHPDTRFDFSAVAKGYGVDCIAEMFERNGVENYLVEIGGEVRVLGLNAQGRPWHIQIDAPSISDQVGTLHQQLMIVSLEKPYQAMATSGNYRNFRTDSTGVVYGHTIDPRTGFPVQSDVLSATVIDSSCGRADALATACMVVGAKEALTLLKSAGAEGLLVVAPDSILMTPGFEKMVKPM